MEKLQGNLVKFYACGTGPEVPEEIVGRTSSFLEGFGDTFGQYVPFIEDDRVLHLGVKKAEEFLKSRESLS